MALQPAQRDPVRDGVPLDDIAQGGDIDVTAQQRRAVAIGDALDLRETTGQQVLTPSSGANGELLPVGSGRASRIRAYWELIERGLL